MAAGRFVEVTEEKINCLKEKPYFSNKHLCNYAKTIIHPRLGEYRWIKPSNSSPFLLTDAISYKRKAKNVYFF